MTLETVCRNFTKKHPVGSRARIRYNEKLHWIKILSVAGTENVPFVGQPSVLLEIIDQAVHFNPSYAPIRDIL